MKFRPRFHGSPIVDQTLIDINKWFGVDITQPVFPTDEDIEIASQFDVKATLEKARRQRKEAGLDV